MEVPTVLLRHLTQLSSNVGLADDALGEPLITLTADLKAAVPSFRGLHVTIGGDPHPVSLTTFLPLQNGATISTSLRVAFAALGAGFGGESRVVFYAATSGAFVDLAADFRHALNTPVSPTRTSAPDSPVGDGQDGRDHTDGDGQHGARHHETEPLIVLDADLPPPTTRSGLAGLEERSMIDRAIGVLIDQGHHPDDAQTTLRRHAAAADVEPHVYAARLLRN